MQFGLMIIGDEILNGSRQDCHFLFFKQLLRQYALQIAWVQYLPDDRGVITQRLKQSFKEKNPVFVTGGIGATPDDHTRQACADALNLPLVPHPEAIKFIEDISIKHGDALSSSNHLHRAQMAYFPENSSIIPNPFNNIAAFSHQQHHFLPGFPQMAHPMAKWVLNIYYQQYFNKQQYCFKAAIVDGLPESVVGPLMEDIEKQWPDVKTYSLPTIREDIAETEQNQHYRLEFGLKTSRKNATVLVQVWTYALQQLQAHGAMHIIELERSSEE
jgi:molybdopterin-biosynthesis enzyme MoeA-like protein